MNGTKMLKAYLKKKGADGLCNEGGSGCACDTDNLFDSCSAKDFFYQFTHSKKLDFKCKIAYEVTCLCGEKAMIPFCTDMRMQFPDCCANKRKENHA